METAPVYQYEVTSNLGSAAPAAFFLTLTEATDYCRDLLGGFINRTDDQRESAPIAPGQQVRFRGPQGLRWVKALTEGIPAGTPGPRFNPGQAVRIFGVEHLLYVQAHQYDKGQGWTYQFLSFLGFYVEALLFHPHQEPTPPRLPTAPAAQQPAPADEDDEPRSKPLLFSLHNVEQFRIDAEERPYWGGFPVDVFLCVPAGHAHQARIVTRCVHSGRLGSTMGRGYELGPYQFQPEADQQPGREGRRYAKPGELAAYLQAQHQALVPAAGAGTLLRLDGSTQELRPVNGKSFEGSELRRALGCRYIDAHRFNHGPYAGYILVLDDEGKFSERAINALATALWYQTYPLGQYSPVDVVAGPVVLMKSALLK